jgi:hypothetical protein
MLSNNPEPSAAQRAILDLGEAGKLVAAEVRADRVARKRHDRLVLILLAVVALAVGGTGVVAWQNRELNAQVRDCTTPGGKCAEQARQQQAANRSALTRANLFIVECATDRALNRTQRGAMRACVEAKLRAEGIDIALISPELGDALPAPSAPAGPPGDVSIAPPSSDQPVEPSPVQPPTTETPPAVPADEPDDTGGTT